MISTVTPCQTSAWRASRLRWTISQTKCAKCCGPRTPGTPAWLPRQVLYRNVLSCRALLHLCTAETAVELWQLKELLFLSPGKQNSGIYLSHHSRNSYSIAQGSVHLMLSKKNWEGNYFFFSICPLNLNSPDICSRAVGLGNNVFPASLRKSWIGRCMFIICKGQAASCSLVLWTLCHFWLSGRDWACPCEDFIAWRLSALVFSVFTSLHVCFQERFSFQKWSFRGRCLMPWTVSCMSSSNTKEMSWITTTPWIPTFTRYVCVRQKLGGCKALFVARQIILWRATLT